MADLEKTDWKVHLAAQQNSGLSIAEYCDRHALKAYNFHYHKRKLRRSEDSKNTNFLQVRVIDEVRPVRMTICGAEVSFDPTTDFSVIGKVIRAAGSCR